MPTDFSYLGDSQHSIFISVFLPEDIRGKLREVYRALNKQARNFRFIDLTQAHITLQFLGNAVSTGSLNIIDEALEATSHNLTSPAITLDTLSFGFPRQRIPSVIHIDISPTKELKDFTRDIHDNVLNIGMEDTRRHKDHAKLIYHLNIARTKRNTSKSFGKKINSLLDTIDFEPITFHPESISLVKSTLSKTKTNYQELDTYKLRQPVKNKAAFGENDEG